MWWLSNHLYRYVLLGVFPDDRFSNILLCCIVLPIFALPATSFHRNVFQRQLSIQSVITSINSSVLNVHLAAVWFQGWQGRARPDKALLLISVLPRWITTAYVSKLSINNTLPMSPRWITLCQIDWELRYLRHLRCPCRSRSEALTFSDNRVVETWSSRGLSYDTRYVCYYPNFYLASLFGRSTISACTV